MLSRRALSYLKTPGFVRNFASGPVAGGTISDELLQKLGSLSTQGKRKLQMYGVI